MDDGSDGIIGDIPTTDDRVRLQLEDGTVIEGELDDDAQIASIADGGAAAVGLTPARSDGTQVHRVLILIIATGGSDAFAIAQMWGDANDEPTAEPVAELTAIDE